MSPDTVLRFDKVKQWVAEFKEFYPHSHLDKGIVNLWMSLFPSSGHI